MYTRRSVLERRKCSQLGKAVRKWSTAFDPDCVWGPGGMVGHTLGMGSAKLLRPHQTPGRWWFSESVCCDRHTSASWMKVLPRSPRRASCYQDTRNTLPRQFPWDATKVSIQAQPQSEGPAIGDFETNQSWHAVGVYFKYADQTQGRSLLPVPGIPSQK